MKPIIQFQVPSLIRVCIILALAGWMPIQMGAAQDWPMFHHDLALSGVTDSQAPDTNYLTWVFETGTPLYSSPVVVNGILYIGSTDTNLYALSADDGSLLWMYPAGSGIYSTPAVEGGLVYFLSTDGTVHCIDAVTGAPVWLQSIGAGPWNWSSPAVSNGGVFVASSNGTMFCLDSVTGAVIWFTPIGGSPDSPISVFNGKVYTGTHNFDTSSPTLVALDENTGAIIWTYYYHLYHGGVVGMVNSNGASIADGDGDGNLEVYFGVYNWFGVGPQAICLDESTGTEKWAATINGNSTSTPAVQDGVVYMGSDDNGIYALDASTGLPLWSFMTGGQVWSAPAVCDGKVIAGSLDHTLYVLNAADGSLVWSYYTGSSRMLGSPAVADGTIFIGNENGKVYAFAVVQAAIDIKPKSCPNPVNVKSKGVLPVAILGTEEFDVTQVIPESVTLIGVAPLKWNLEDVATPYLGDKTDCLSCTEEGADGFLDLVLHFDTPAVIAALGDVSDGDCLLLEVSGLLSNGANFSGEDVVTIKKKGIKVIP